MTKKQFDEIKIWLHTPGYKPHFRLVALAYILVSELERVNIWDKEDGQLNFSAEFAKKPEI